MEWYLTVLRDNYFNFSGRARRSEYWYYILFNIIAIAILALLVFASEELMFLLGLYIIAVIIPTLAVAVRRLHDQNKSGWYFLVRFIPIIGTIWLLILFCTEGTRGPNRYGADPKNKYDEFEEIGKSDYI
jgi:uncharacterized membrane protein YhaH (DUF805 family)